jgi:hypothetical protein
VAKEVNIRVRGVRRPEPDLRRLARALLHEAATEQRRRQAAAEQSREAARPAMEAPS